MISTISVSANIYKLTQDQQTKLCTFYVYNQSVKTIEQSSVLPIDDLFTILFDEALEYQNSQEEAET